MKCPNCQEEMEKGTLVANGSRWVKSLSKIYEVLFKVKGDVVIAWKCAGCKKVELVTE